MKRLLGLPTNLKKIRFLNILPFIVWPLLFFAAFFIMYFRFVNLYENNLICKCENASYQVEGTFDLYLTQIDNVLKGSAATLEYMLDTDASEETMLQFITYESERLGIVSSTGARGIFGVFDGKFLHGLGWNPENYDPTERVWYQEAIKANGQYVLVGPYFNKRTDEYVITAVKMLKDGESVIAFAIDYETFKKMTTSGVTADESHMVLAMNGAGIVLANSNDDEMGVDYSVSQDPFKKAIYNAIMTNGGKSTFTLRTGNDTKDRYIISRRHVLYNLYVVTITNEDAELDDLKKSAILFGGMLFLGIVIILVLNIIALFRDLKARQRAENLNAIANIYSTVLRIDMKQDTYEKIAVAEYRTLKFFEGAGYKASVMMKEAAAVVADDRSKADLLTFTDLSTLSDRMKGRDTIAQEFLSFEHLWQRARFIVVERDKDGNVEDVIFASEIIDDEKRTRDKLQYLAETDQLTGINRRGIGENKIRDLLKKNVGGMFIMFDVDKFKYVNDHFGHEVGDKVLVAVGEAMHKTFREKDIIMRLGGDEFAAYVPGVYTENGGNQIIERLIGHIDEMDIPELGEHKISISIGAAFFYPTDTFGFEELYNRADSGTYDSKKVEGSEVTFYKRMDSGYNEGE